ncbi:hypothetical protein N665_0072s0038 [Sinapis alba]|nr:hypothetical protein N665_0072s0038 [Sinapis alba]
MGVVGLAKGLRKFLIPDVPDEHCQILVTQGCTVREIEPVIPPENQAGYAMAYYVINYSKLRVWEVSWSKTPQYEIGYCQHSPEKLTWSVETYGHPLPMYFNAGDFLNMYFKDIYKPIPTTYNLVMAMLWRHPEHVDLDQIKVVHYCAKGSKPWRFTGAEEHMDRKDIKMLVKKWWEIYDDSSLDYTNFAETELRLNPIITTRASKEPVVDCLTSLAPSAA